LQLQIFPNPVYLTTPVRQFPLELGNTGWMASRNKNDGATRSRKVWWSHYPFKTIHVWQTDIQTDTS